MRLHIVVKVESCFYGRSSMESDLLLTSTNIPQMIVRNNLLTYDLVVPSLRRRDLIRTFLIAVTRNGDIDYLLHFCPKQVRTIVKTKL